MTFLEQIKPHLISRDALIQDTVLQALHHYPNVPEEWTLALLEEAFKNREKQSAILIDVENQPIKEEAVKILIENMPKMNQSKIHLAKKLLNNIEPELALKYRQSLEKYINKDMWSLYKLLINGTEEDVYSEYGQTLADFEHSETYQYDLYIKAKTIAAWLVKKNWITEDEIGWVLEEELKNPFISFNGILNVYMAGLLKLDKHIPLLASLLVRDEDILLEEICEALIRFQSDEVVNAVKPYINNQESIIFALSILENIKSNLSIQVLREAYHSATSLEDEDMIVEALCHQLSVDALPEIAHHMEKEYFTTIVDIELTAYSYYSILGLAHPGLEGWKDAASEREMDFREIMTQDTSVLSNIPIRNEGAMGSDP
ncbi:MAG: zinc chelation protein SecC [Bacillus sp. (in: firmicutes)]